MGCLNIGLLVVIATACAAQVCEPDETKRDGDQICFCLGDGTGWVCAMSAPSDSSPSTTISSMKNSDDDTCEPDTYFVYYCNECYCGADGKSSKAACTKMYCDPKIWNKDGSIKSSNEIKVVSTNVRKIREIAGQCEPGKTFPSYCNECTCGSTGRVDDAACTKLYCDPEIWNEDGTTRINNERQSKSLSMTAAKNDNDNEKRCEPGKLFKKFCNNCRCPDNGLTARAPCTRMYCDPTEWNSDGSMKIVDDTRLSDDDDDDEDDVCEPGTPFKKYCNTCYCDENRRKSKSRCGTMLCNHDVWNRDGTPKITNKIASYVTFETIDDNEERCQPGTRFRKYCNNCRCGKNGLVARAGCTRMLCDRTVWNRDGTRKTENENLNYETIERPLKEERCTPGKEFKRYCNTCVCGETGLVTYASCTKNHCDPGVWEKNGDRKYEVAFIPMMMRKKRSTKIVCQPGRTYIKDCNSCVCGKDGMGSSCTLMNCQPGKNGFAAPQVCEPGKRFKIDCNDCACSGNGLKVTCTDKVCSPSV